MLTLLFSTDIYAANFETLFMPGEVIEGHAKFEEECSKCHHTLKKENQNGLCLDCHDKIREDINNKTGFHGKTTAISKSECKSCHTDHKGRGADIVKLNRDLFDHRNTDFPLLGGHEKAACTACHKQGDKFRDAPTDCIACHKKDDRHKGSLGKACADCHTVNSWSKQRFDHEKTRFPLTGRHADILCNSCHAGEKYKGTPVNCINCHALNDKHLGGLGKECKSCHTTRAWKTISFDHNKDTKFTLRNKHATASCAACHRKDPYKNQTSSRCIACHRGDDIHKGRNGEKCSNCHQDKSWKNSTFNHDTDTEFVLTGGHKDTACVSCHKTGVYNKSIDKTCIACHKLDDPHKGSQGDKCDKCHITTGWGADIRFEHDLSRFPLIGQHAVVSCEECHKDATYKNTPMACNSCHEKDDVHNGGLSPRCESCHNPNSWLLWQFDHNTQTDYPLEGKHGGVACGGCHRKALRDKDKPDRRCYSCHSKDDVHSGGFGLNCERCHTTEGFKETIFNSR